MQRIKSTISSICSIQPVILVDITRFMKFDEIYILSLQPYYIHSEDISIPGIQFISILSDI